MKQLILIKQSPFIDLAHLYEHLFCARIQEFFYDKHLFERLDYNLDGKMYHGGVIYIDLELYTSAAIELADQIKPLELTIDEETLFIAAAQLLAEKGEPIGSTGYDNVRSALEDLHDQPWQNIDDVELVDTKRVRKRTGPFYMAEGKPLPARKLTTGVFLDVEFAASNRELLPLFRQFACIITVNVQNMLGSTYGYYSFEDSYKNTKDRVGMTNVFKVANANDVKVDLPDTIETFLEVVQSLRQYNAFDRYMSELRAISHYDHPDLAPNPERNYEDTLMFIGSKGWEKIATQKNYELLLKHMSIEVKFGRDKISQPL